MKCQMKPMDFSSGKTGENVFNSQAIEDVLTAARPKKARFHGASVWGVGITNKSV
jgi:hypothetical protein